MYEFAAILRVGRQTFASAAAPAAGTAHAFIVTAPAVTLANRTRPLRRTFVVGDAPTVNRVSTAALLTSFAANNGINDSAISGPYELFKLFNPTKQVAVRVAPCQLHLKLL